MEICKIKFVFLFVMFICYVGEDFFGLMIDTVTWKKTVRKMVLSVKSNEKMKRSAQQSVVSEREKRPKSKSRPKSKQKKSTKIDAKMPKKPPTAFFYFL